VAGVLSSDESRGDVDRKTVGRLVGDGDVEILNVSAVDVAGRARKRQAGCETMLSVLDVGGSVAGANCLSNLGLGILDVGEQVCAYIDGSRQSVLHRVTTRGLVFAVMEGLWTTHVVGVPCRRTVPIEAEDDADVICAEGVSDTALVGEKSEVVI